VCLCFAAAMCDWPCGFVCNAFCMQCGRC
jgi:hypothetical protein